jgi:hypothetical protein
MLKTFVNMCMNLHVIQVSQEERSVYWEVIVLVIVSQKLNIHMCPIQNGF